MAPQGRQPHRAQTRRHRHAHPGADLQWRQQLRQAHSTHLGRDNTESEAAPNTTTTRVPNGRTQRREWRSQQLVTLLVLCTLCCHHQAQTSATKLAAALTAFSSPPPTLVQHLTPYACLDDAEPYPHQQQLSNNNPRWCNRGHHYDGRNWDPRRSSCCRHRGNARRRSRAHHRNKIHHLAPSPGWRAQPQQNSRNHNQPTISTSAHTKVQPTLKP